MGGSFAATTAKKYNGQSAAWSIDDLEGVFPIPYDSLPTDKGGNIVQSLLAHLMDLDLIESRPLDLTLGSTRLAALHYYNMKGIKHEIFMAPFETSAHIIPALNFKRFSFGDLDIGVRYIAKKREIADAVGKYLTKHGFEHATRLGADIHVAILLDKSWRQLDISDMGSDPAATRFRHFSSLIDLANGLPGSLRNITLNVLGRFPVVYTDRIEFRESLDIVTYAAAPIKIDGSGEIDSSIPSIKEKLDTFRADHIIGKPRYTIGKGVALVVDCFTTDDSQRRKVIKICDVHGCNFSRQGLQLMMHIFYDDTRKWTDPVFHHTTLMIELASRDFLRYETDPEFDTFIDSLIQSVETSMKRAGSSYSEIGEIAHRIMQIAHGEINVWNPQSN